MPQLLWGIPLYSPAETEPPAGYDGPWLQASTPETTAGLWNDSAA